MKLWLWALKLKNRPVNPFKVSIIKPEYGKKMFLKGISQLGLMVWPTSIVMVDNRSNRQKKTNIYCYKKINYCCNNNNSEIVIQIFFIYFWVKSKTLNFQDTLFRVLFLFLNEYDVYTIILNNYKYVGYIKKLLCVYVLQTCNSIKKGAPTQVFSCRFC